MRVQQSIRLVLASILCVIYCLGLVSCTSTAPVPPAAKSNEAQPLKKMPSSSAPINAHAPISQAKNLNAYAREVAVHISQKNSDKIYVSNPQALLRSVVVLKFSIDARGNLISRELVRSNKDKVTETTAMQSILLAQPFPIPSTSLLKQGKLELLETWLFNNDGRFQLRTISLPQLGE